MVRRMVLCAGALLLGACWASHDRSTVEGPAASDAALDAGPDAAPATEEEPAREVRIAILVDGTESMSESDPVSPVDGRSRVQDALDALVTARLPEASILLAVASGFVSVWTQCDGDGDGLLDVDCFTHEPLEVSRAIAQLDPNGLMGSWSTNVGLFAAAIRDDVAAQAAPETVQWAALVITDEGGAVTEDAQDAVAEVAALREDVRAAGGRFVLSAVVLDARFGGAGAQVASPLAEAGDGTTLRVPAEEAFDLTALVPDGS